MEDKSDTVDSETADCTIHLTFGLSLPAKKSCFAGCRRRARCQPTKTESDEDEEEQNSIPIQFKSVRAAEAFRTHLDLKLDSRSPPCTAWVFPLCCKSKKIWGGEEDTSIENWGIMRRKTGAPMPPPRCHHLSRRHCTRATCALYRVQNLVPTMRSHTKRVLCRRAHQLRLRRSARSIALS